MIVTKLLGVAAVGAMLALAAPAAHAMSLAGPGTATAMKQGAAAQTTEVRWHHGWHRGWLRGWRPHRWHRGHRHHW